MELGSQETYPVISCGRLQHKVTNHHSKSKSQERATELREGWTGEGFKATGSCDLVEAAMTANEKPYGEVPSSQPLMSAESDQAGGRGLCKCTFWKHTCSVVPGAGNWLGERHFARLATWFLRTWVAPLLCAAQWDWHAQTAGL